MIDIPQDWLNGLYGGSLIGLAGAIYLIFNGRIAGISGIIGNVMGNFKHAFTSGPFFFLIGLIIAPAIFSQSGHSVPLTVTTNLPLLICGGLLVGFGTRLGSGCTSGHGVCGISRFSVRSFTATCLFMGFAGLTVFIMNHVVGG